MDILHKSNPWAGEQCERSRCLLCTTKREAGKTNSQDCRQRNIVYETTCITCTERQDLEIEQRYGEEGKKRKREEPKGIYISAKQTGVPTREG